jgi:hypothetical protein
MGEIKEPVSNTSIIEKRIRMELEAKYGPILDRATVEAVERRELEALKKRQATIERARLKLLRIKDVARLRQKVRREYARGLRDCPENTQKREGANADSQVKTETPLMEAYY